MPFRTLLLPSSLERQNKVNFRSMSNKLPSSEVTKMNSTTSHDSLCTSWSSSTKTKVKDMENGLIFRVTVQIQILTVFSVQSKYSKKTKSISCGGLHSKAICCMTSVLPLGFLWKFDTLWEHPLGKGEATCHSSPWYMVLCTEDVWKATTRVPCSHITRMVENTLLVAEGICTTISISLRTYHSLTSGDVIEQC